MGTRLRILIILGVIFALIYIISMIKREKLELKYTLSWMIAAFAVLVMAIFPSIMDWMAQILNIYSTVNALFFIGMCFILVILFSLTIAMSRNSRKLKDMVQKIALLEHEIQVKDAQYYSPRLENK